MRVLLDTHIVLAVLHPQVDRLPRLLVGFLEDPTLEGHASVASLWEIAIKVRLGKLHIGLALADIPPALRRFHLTILNIEARHALAEALPVPATRDPFDRMLLALCAVEDLRLVTTDRALAAHPLAWPVG